MTTYHNIPMSKTDTEQQIKDILEKKKLDDLNKFISKVERLNMLNSYIVYIFHIFQTCGIFISSYATSKNDDDLFWLGIGLNMFASLIHVFEKINDAQIKKIDNEINLIKNDTYVSEDSLIPDDDFNNNNNNNNNNDNNTQKISLTNITTSNNSSNKSNITNVSNISNNANLSTPISNNKNYNSFDTISKI